jgi:hypothetical protein
MNIKEASALLSNATGTWCIEYSHWSHDSECNSGWKVWVQSLSSHYHGSTLEIAVEAALDAINDKPMKYDEIEAQLEGKKEVEQ